MLNAFSALLKKPVQAIALLVTVAMVVLAASQVLFRYVLAVSVPWTEEVVRVLFIWMIFIGTALVESEGSQVRTMLLVDKFPRPLRLAREVVVTLVSILFQAILLVGSIQSYRSSSHLTLGSVPWLDHRVLFLPVIIAAPLCIWFMLANLVKIKRRLYPETT